MFATITSLLNSWERKRTTLAVEAPRILRMPISLVRRITVSVANPNSPKQAIRIVKNEAYPTILPHARFLHTVVEHPGQEN